jgi:hypothetical protein
MPALSGIFYALFFLNFFCNLFAGKKHWFIFAALLSERATGG